MLIVDDSAEDRYLLRRYLNKTGLSLEILEASSGLEGIDFLTVPTDQLILQHPNVTAPVIVFLDINMPLMNGWEVVKELELRRDNISLNPIVVIMHSTGNAKYEAQKIDDFELIKSYIVKGDSTPALLRESILNVTTQS